MFLNQSSNFNRSNSAVSACARRVRSQCWILFYIFLLRFSASGIN